MKVVLDASAAIRVVFKRDGVAQFLRSIEEADVVLAPDLFVAEVVNTIWKCHQFEHRPLDICDRALAASLRLVDTFVPSIDICDEAFLLARTCGRPAYDMFYLALARHEDASLLTADAALRKQAQKQGIRVSPSPK